MIYQHIPVVLWIHDDAELPTPERCCGANTGGYERSCSDSVLGSPTPLGSPKHAMVPRSSWRWSDIPSDDLLRIRLNNPLAKWPNKNDQSYQQMSMDIISGYLWWIHQQTQIVWVHQVPFLSGMAILQRLRHRHTEIITNSLTMTKSC